MREAPRSCARNMAGASPWCVAGDPCSVRIVRGISVRVSWTNSRVIWKRVKLLHSATSNRTRLPVPVGLGQRGRFVIWKVALAIYRRLDLFLGRVRGGPTRGGGLKIFEAERNIVGIYVTSTINMLLVRNVSLSIIAKSGTGPSIPGIELVPCLAISLCIK